MTRSFPRSLDSLERAFEYVRTFVASEKLDGGFAHDIDLVLEELFTNLVKYGRGDRGPIEIGLERTGARVRAWLRESAAEIFDPTNAPQVDVTRPLGERPLGGLGLHLVRQMTEEFRYEWKDGVGTTSVTLRIPD